VDLTDSYVPVGTTSLVVSDASSYQAGDLILIERAASEAWIHSIGMDTISDCELSDCRQWEADDCDLKLERGVVSVDTETNTIVIDAPTVHNIQGEKGSESTYCAPLARLREKLSSPSNFVLN